MRNNYQDLVNRLTEKVNLGFIPVYISYDIENAQAVFNPNTGQRYIQYNPDFIAELHSYSYWAVLMVFAHEVAHHYNHDLRSNFFGRENTSHKKELNADWFAGWILFCEGASLDQATDVFEAYPFSESHSHPGANKRIAALTDGWRKANCRYNPPRKVTKPKDNTGEILIGVAAGLALIIGIGAAIRN